MQSRRTMMIAAVVALVGLSAAAVIAALHMHADVQRKRYEVLIDLEADANRIDALESQANAERRVPLVTQAEVHQLLDDMSAELADLVDREAVGVADVRDVFEVDRPQIVEEFALMRSRDFRRAGAVDERVDFERIRHGLRRAADVNATLADRSDHLSWIGTVIVMLLSIVGLT